MQVAMVTDVIRGCLEDAGVTADAIDRFAPYLDERRTIES